MIWWIRDRWITNRCFDRVVIGNILVNCLIFLLGLALNNIHLLVIGLACHIRFLYVVGYHIKVYDRDNLEGR